MSKAPWINLPGPAGAGLLVLLSLLSVLPSPALADLDLDFDSYDAGRWESPRYFGSGGIDPSVSYEGTPDTLDAITIDGATALRITSVMSNFQRKAIASKRIFDFSEGEIHIRFRTMPRADPTIPAENTENIDGLLDFWLVNPDSRQYLNFRLFGGEFGENRIASVRSSLGAGVQIDHAAWGYGNWYELRIVSNSIGTTVTYLAEDGTDILDHTFDSDLCELGGFQVVFGQMMGRPNVESYSDIAVDYLRIDERAECDRDDDEPVPCTVGPADTAVTIPVHPTTPACLCFQDRVSRSDTHCMFLHPYFTGVWRFAPEVPPREPFRVQWLFTPHTGPASSARVAVDAPPGFQRLSEKRTGPGKPARAVDHVWLISGDTPGAHSAEIRFKLPDENKPVRARFPIRVKQPRAD